jgi:fermentation-respiration switch protein FrsA (DUF1100 family)
MLKFFLIISLCYVLFVAFIYFTQHRLLYLPNLPGRAVNMTPADAGMGYEDVALETVDGVRLHGWFVSGIGPRTLLFFHGNAGNVSHRLESIHQFRELGLSVLIIDYRGYGRSEGRPTEAGTYRDADAAWRYLTEDRDTRPEDIVIFGRSLGGPIAARLAAQQQPAGLIVESAFSSVPDIASELYRFLPVRWLSRFDYATREHMRDVRCPVLIVHSRDDEIIPYHHGEAIFAAAGEPRALLTLSGSHNGAHIVSEKPYVEGLRAFLHSLDGPEG